MFNFEVFDSKAAPPPTTPTVTFQARGYISFNRGAYELLGNPTAVQFLYDRKEKIVAFRSIPSDTPGAVLLRKQSQSSTFIIGARRFLHHFGITMQNTVRFAASKYEDMLIVDLKEEGIAVTGPRAKAEV